MNNHKPLVHVRLFQSVHILHGTPLRYIAETCTTLLNVLLFQFHLINNPSCDQTERVIY